VFCYDVDLAHVASLEEMVELCVKESSGQVDYVINNAGYVDPKSVVETTYENFDLTFKLNCYAPFFLIRKLISLRVYPKTIINVASTAGLSARPGWSAYASSKAALINLTDTLSEELKGFGVRVMSVAPGRCATDLRKRLAPEEDPSTIMQPQDVAQVVNHLLGDMGKFIDKQCLVIKK